jgi:hypothetical protein
MSKSNKIYLFSLCVNIYVKELYILYQETVGVAIIEQQFDMRFDHEENAAHLKHKSDTHNNIHHRPKIKEI